MQPDAQKRRCGKDRDEILRKGYHMKIKIYRFSNMAHLERAHYNDSGADCFCCETVIIPPHSTVKIPTGIGVDLPDGYDIVVHCKSGLASKGIFAANCPVDAGYRPSGEADSAGYYYPEQGGQIHAVLLNTTDEPYTFHAGDKIGQFVVRPVIYADFVDSLGDERGGLGFGSTGK